MFDYEKWVATGFVFELCGVRFFKPESYANFSVDECDHEVYPDEPASHEMPILIMALIATRTLD